MLATAHGKKIALEQLAARRCRAKIEKKIDNSALHAGSDMFFECLTCGCQDIRVPENYVDRPKLCPECNALKDLGWLE